MKIKILLIEDEYGLRQSLLIMLKAEGYQVISAENGSIGVDFFRTEHPDLVICDLRMPGLDGAAVLDIVRRDPETQATPFICISAIDKWDAPGVVQALGHENFLQKPFSREDLLWAINRQLCPLTTRQLHHPNAAKVQPQYSAC